MEKSKYYISTGQTGAKYTLRYSDYEWRKGYLGRPYQTQVDYHQLTLTTDYEESLSRAKEYLQGLGIDPESIHTDGPTSLRKIKKTKIDHQILRFGKYSGKSISEILDSDPEYLIWVSRNMRSKKHQKTLDLISESVKTIEPPPARTEEYEVSETYEELYNNENHRKPKESQYVGEIKKHLELTVTYTGLTSFDTQYGTMTIYFLQDENRNELIWKTSAYLSDDQDQGIEKGKTIKITATVKDHNLYCGRKQTVLTRVKVTKIL